ncbi:hypothetical protein PVL29_023850 [Vitis rotundifolia]|uniref:TF-B3 domain-containing protein n=1 Tax=Vitis rotundifolia TaxID=103349 RepID=A0AA38YQ59_VITRO|nr:hypothetical protein PVL29_023850 [Vitis rotundifolia]
MKNSKRPHFFEVFQPDASSERLKIPSRFIKHMEGRTSGFVSLVGPSDNTWHVDLIQQNGDLFLHDGWPVFVRDHCIECGDSLVFRYDGNLHFTVQVFDRSSCEKEAAFHTKCSQDPGGLDDPLRKKRERESPVVSKDKIFEGVPKKMRGSSCHVHSECITKNLEDKMDKSDKEECKCEDLFMTEKCQAAVFSNETKKCGSPSKDSLSPMPSQLKACNEKPEAAIQSRADDEFDSRARGCGCTFLLSTSEEKKVAQSFTSSFPNFVRIMKKFNISGSYTLKIPYKFSMEHLPKCKIKIVLRNLKGDCWTVNSVPTTKVHTLHTFCGGWMAFVRGNDLKMGDICIFELVRKCEMRVHILGAGKEGIDGQSGKTMSNGFTPGCAATSHKNPEGLPKKPKGNSSKVHLKHITKLGVSGKKGSKTHQDNVPNEMKKRGSSSKSSVGSASKACNEKPEAAIQNTTSAADELRSQAKSFVSTISAEEEKAVRSFTSSYPYFARFMKKFNISGSYTLVSSFLIVSLFCFNLYLFMSGLFAVPRMNETHYCIISE